MNDVEVKLNISAEYKAAMKAIAHLSVALKKLQEQSKVVMDAGTGAAKNNAVSPELAKALTGQQATLAEATKGIAQLQQAISELTAQGAAGAEELNKLVAAFSSMAGDKGAGANAEALEELEEKLKNATAEITRLQDAIQELEQTQAEAAEKEKQRSAQSDRLTAADIKRREAAAAAMKYENMNRQQIAAEIERLIKLRAEAAEAEDSDAWEGYNAEIIAGQKALREFNKEQQIHKIGLQQQAQTGMMAANTMGDLAASISTGNIQIGQMIMQIMSLSSAIKAGLGPIGWLMLAIQGLQLAWNEYAKAQEKAREAEKRKREELKKAAAEIAELEGKVYELQRRLADSEYKKNLNKELEALELALNMNKIITAEREKQAQILHSELEERKKASMFELEMQELELRTQYERGEISDSDLTARKRNIEAARAAVLAGSTSELLTRKQENAERAAIESRYFYNEMRDKRDALGQQLRGRTLEGVELAEARRAALQKTLATEQERAQDLARQRDAKRNELELSRAFRAEDDALHTELEEELKTLERDTARRADNVAQLQKELEELGEPVNLERFRSLLDAFNEVTGRVSELEKQLRAAEESAADAAAAVTRHNAAVEAEQARQTARARAEDELTRTRQQNEAFKTGLQEMTDSDLQDAAQDTGKRGSMARAEQTRRRRERAGAARKAAALQLVEEYRAAGGKVGGFEDIAALTSGERALTYRDDDKIAAVFNAARRTVDTSDDSLLDELLDLLHKSENAAQSRRRKYEQLRRKILKQEQ